MLIDSIGVLGKYRDALHEAMVALVPREPEAMYQMLQYHLGWIDIEGNPVLGESTGKGLRPLLCLLTCEALGSDWSRATTIAATLELIHNFSLIHDDIQDKDEERRGRKTVWSVWGVGKALWAGNAMRILSDRALDMDEISFQKRVQAAELLTQAYLRMIEGQYIDLAFETQTDISIDEYLNMIGRKTGALIRCAVELGTLVATDDHDVMEALGNWGAHIGTAFQVRDDMLGIWGKSEKTGKPTGNDIRRKKKTFPVVYAFANSDEKRLQTLRDIFALDELTESEVQIVMDILDSTGAYASAQNLVTVHTEHALKALHDLGSVTLSQEGQQMIELTGYLAYRDS